MSDAIGEWQSLTVSALITPSFHQQPIARKSETVTFGSHKAQEHHSSVPR
jgi:hypothetical protein